MKDQSIISFLAEAQLRIKNSQKTPAISTLMEPRGYDEAAFQEATQLLDAAYGAQDKQEEETAEALEATQEKDLLLAEVSRTYDTEKPVLQVVFKDDLVAQKKLGLFTTKRRTQPARIKQIKDLFQGLQKNEEWKQKAAGRGVTAEVIDDSVAKIEKVEALVGKQKKEYGEAQQATKDRNVIFEKLEEWLDEFEKVAKAALSTKPQLLEVLGIFVRS